MWICGVDSGVVDRQPHQFLGFCQAKTSSTTHAKLGADYGVPTSVLVLSSHHSDWRSSTQYLSRSFKIPAAEVWWEGFEKGGSPGSPDSQKQSGALAMLNQSWPIYESCRVCFYCGRLAVRLDFDLLWEIESFSFLFFSPSKGCSTQER